MRRSMRCVAGLSAVLSILSFSTSFLNTPLLAQQNDDSVIVVQAFTFDDEPTLHAWGNIFEYDGMVAFPEPGERYEKILIYYTLKCDARTKADGFACGEWDYSTWIRVWEDSASHWEIGRFITPYGINLDLGPEGFTWVFDVTDYAPVLRDVKRVTAGNSQELLDMKFVFIKGTPPRDPLSVTRLWNAGSPSYERIVRDSDLAPIQVPLNPDAAMFAIHTRPQGGNFNGGDNTDNCAEFCDREHWLTIDGTERFRWNVWKTCGRNPVYPQGGTWVFDRAGWCPGAIVNTQRHELTPHVTPGETITIDYGIENPPQFVPYGHWVFWADLVAYGPPNHSLDVSLEAILAPSNVGLYGRMNPICSSPAVRIRNTGSETLTSLTIEYGIDGSPMESYTWTGSLGFLEEADVQLPALPMEQWESGATTLSARVRDPNGSADQYARNDFAESTFELPPVHPRQLEIRLKTNKQAADQYEWELLTADGTKIHGESNLSDDTEYVYPVDLPLGCYTFRLVNRLGFGLDFFAVRPSLGTGSLRFTSGPAVLKQFDPDFGSEVFYQFRVGNLPTMQRSVDTLRFGRVKPGSEVVRSVTITPANALGIEIENVLILSGASAFTIESIEPSLGPGPVVLQEGESMTISVRFKPNAERDFNSRIVIQGNDFRGSAQYVYLAGTGDASVSVDDEPVAGAAGLSLRIVPSAVTERGTIIFNTGAERKEHVTLRLVDVTGREVATLLDESASAGERKVALATQGIAPGTYFVVLRAGDRMVAEEVQVR